MTGHDLLKIYTSNNIACLINEYLYPSEIDIKFRMAFIHFCIRDLFNNDDIWLYY